jgi:hypothetical protein
LKVDESVTEAALEKASRWCEVISHPAPEFGVAEARFTVPACAANAYQDAYAVTITGEITYSEGTGAETARRERRQQWEMAASRAANRIGAQVIRFS